MDLDIGNTQTSPTALDRNAQHMQQAPDCVVFGSAIRDRLHLTAQRVHGPRRQLEYSIIRECQPACQ